MNATYSFQNVVEILQHLPANLQQEILDFAEFVAQKHNSKINSVGESEEIYKLSNEQKKAIGRGIEDIKNKKVISDETASKQIDSWLKK